MFLTSLLIATSLSAAPLPATAAVPPLALHVATDSVPVLTADALTKMTNFWAAFMKESPAIRDTARKQHQKPLTIPSDAATTGRATIQMQGVVDMIGMANKYPTVASDLKNSGLTAQQWDQYRAALLSAYLTSKLAKSTPATTSVVGQNVAFLAAHPKEFAALQATGMWFPAIQQGGMGGGMGGGNDDLNP